MTYRRLFPYVGIGRELMRTAAHKLPASALVFLVAIAVRLTFILLLGSEQRLYDSNFDQNIYIDIARNLLEGRGFSVSYDIFVASSNRPTSIQPPVYPFMLASVFALFGENYLLVRLVQILMSAAICVCVYHIGKRTMGEKAGIIAGIVTAFYPALVMYVRPLTTEILFALLLSLGTLLLIKYVQQLWRPVHYMAWGGVLSIAFLLRPEVLVFAALSTAFIVAWTIRYRQRSVRSLMSGLMLTAVICLLTIMPWALRNLDVHGELLFTANKRWAVWEAYWLRYMRETNPDWMEGKDCNHELECAIPDFDQMTELERDRYAVALASDFIRAHPLMAMRYAVSQLLVSYPLIPREELPPPLGYKGERQRPEDGFDYTSLDDHPTYERIPEKLRVWSFRLIFALAILGCVIAVRRRVWIVLLPMLPVIANMITALLLSGKERYRVSIDQFLVLTSVYTLSVLFVWFGSKMQHYGWKVFPAPDVREY
jgi:4-amino-4-deoxy-L-arabinose transferase-like glycosyltransferase